MREREIDGHKLWVGAEKIGTKSAWVGTIAVQNGDGEVEIHSLGEQSFDSPIQADNYAEQRLMAVTKIGSEMELFF